MSAYVWLLMDCNHYEPAPKDCLLSIGRKSFEHDLAARPAALDQRVSLLQIGRVEDGAQRFRQRRLDHSGIDTSSDTSETEIAESLDGPLHVRPSGQRISDLIL